MKPKNLNVMCVKKCSNQKQNFLNISMKKDINKQNEINCYIFLMDNNVNSIGVMEQQASQKLQISNIKKA